jgi:hypothetical protein
MTPRRLGYADAVRRVETLNHFRRMVGIAGAEIAPVGYLTLLDVPHDALMRIIGASIEASRRDADTMRRWARYPRAFRLNLVRMEGEIEPFAIQRITPGKPVHLVELIPTATPEAWPVTVDSLPPHLRRHK